jgi:hypothetical protein
VFLFTVFISVPIGAVEFVTALAAARPACLNPLCVEAKWSFLSVAQRIVLKCDVPVPRSLRFLPPLPRPHTARRQTGELGLSWVVLRCAPSLDVA